MNTALRLVSTNLAKAGKKDYINHLISNEPKYGVLFSDYIAICSAKKAKRMGKTYMNNYNTLRMHLIEFSESNDASIFTNSVNEEFLDDFIVFLQEKNLKHSYIKQLVELAKAMVRKSITDGYATDPSFANVQLEDDEFFAIYLSMNEITRIYYYQGLTKIQERTRDLFIVGCLTALRFSDYSTLTKNNFNGDFITKITKKTGKKVIIPIHDYVGEIFLKYNYEIPCGICIQQFNRAIKLICN